MENENKWEKKVASIKLIPLKGLHSKSNDDGEK